MKITIEDYETNGKYVDKATYTIPDGISLEDVHWDVVEEMFALAADD